MAPYWFPVLTLVLGAAASQLADLLRDKRAARRELVVADRQERRELAAAQRERDIARDAFQRETLLELQDWLAKLARASGAIHHHDEMEYRRSGEWRRTPVGEEFNLGLHTATVNVNRLRVRVADDAIRADTEEFQSTCIMAAILAVSEVPEMGRTLATEAYDRMGQLNGPLHDLIGERLRELA